MYIRNLNGNNKRFYMCGKVIGKYLIKKGIPLLSRENELMVFSRTKKLQKAIDEMPFYLKLLRKVGVIDG